MDINKFEKQMDWCIKPYIENIPQKAAENKNFRTTLWTGKYAQMTIMCIPVCSDIGMEIHEDTDQIIRIEQGLAVVKMGSTEHTMDYQRRVSIGDTIFVPAGTWHNIVNIGRIPLKVSTIYAPPHHPAGTIHRTKNDSQTATTDYFKHM